MSELWLEVQQMLRALGHDPGPLDGHPGPLTAAAVKDALERLPAAPGSLLASAVQLVGRQPFAARTINEIVVHCTATPAGRAVTADQIRAWHKAKGWRDIGYHYVVRLDGTIEPGRAEAEVGAHVLGRNEGTLGVVYVGGVAANGVTAIDTRTDAQKAAMDAICRALCMKYPKITLISGHREYAAKDCPSFDVRRDPLAAIPQELEG